MQETKKNKRDKREVKKGVQVHEGSVKWNT